MTDQRTAVYQFATTQEQNILKQQQTQNDQAFTLYQNNLSQAQSLAKTALTNGQGTLATSIAALDPNSPTFQADLAKLEGQIATPVAASSGFNLSAGQSHYDAQGNLVATNRSVSSRGGGSVGVVGNGSGGAIGTTGTSAVDATTQGYASNIVSGTGGMTQAAIDQAALSYALTGQMPMGARSSTGVALQMSTAIKNRAAEMSAGGNIQGNKATLAANSASLKTQVEYLNTTQRAFNTANDTLDALTTWMSQNGINASQFPDYNAFVNYAKAHGIDPGAAGGYNAQIATLRSEYAQVLARGGSVTDASRAAANELIPTGLSPAQLQKVADRIKVDGTNVINDAQQQVTSIQNKINNIVAPGGTGATGGGAPKGSQTDSAYVESTLTSQGLKYADVMSKIPSGQKGVIDNATGQIGSIPPSEFDPTKYTSL